MVTSTRRRSARRAAGPPVSTQVPQLAQTQVDEHDGDADATSTRSTTGSATGRTGNDAEDAEGGFVLHVPIKRKGSRKR